MQWTIHSSSLELNSCKTFAAKTAIWRQYSLFAFAGSMNQALCQTWLWLQVARSVFTSIKSHREQWIDLYIWPVLDRATNLKRYFCHGSSGFLSIFNPVLLNLFPVLLLRFDGMLLWIAAVAMAMDAAAAAAGGATTGDAVVTVSALTCSPVKCKVSDWY